MVDRQVIGTNQSPLTEDVPMSLPDEPTEKESVSIHDVIDELNKGNWDRDDTPIDRELSSSMVDHPAHYNGHPKGIECIDVIEDAPFNIGAAIKYLWRVVWGNKGNKIEDCEKAIWYINRHIDNLKNGTAK